MIFKDFISKLPGINSKNIRKVMNNVDDFKQLVSMSQVYISKAYFFIARFIMINMFYLFNRMS